MKSDWEANKILREFGLRPSSQRVKILSFMLDNFIHPNADQIYDALKSELPSLSKTTVYNNLAVLTKAGIVKLLSLDSNEARYDLAIFEHGHFQCESCGRIIDIKIDMSALKSQDLKDYKVVSQQVNFRGICDKCLKSSGA
jgi:Fur family peroxide stress response transcriptional regulator